MTEVLFDVNVVIIVAGVLLAGLGVSEMAARIGRRVGSELDAVARANLNTVEAAMLALIGLLLAFSMSMAVARFDLRRELMVAEVDAIGTAWLRSGLMPEPTRSSLRSDLAAYAKTRVDLFEAPNYRTVAPEAKGEAIRTKVWEEAAVVAASDPRSIPAGLLIQSLNDMIDLHTRRDVANVNHVPELVWWLLIFVTLLAMAAVGFNDAQGSRSNLGARIVLGLALSATFALTLDLDRPRRGIITVSQAPMRELRDSLGAQVNP